MPLLEVRGLDTIFTTPDGPLRAAAGLSFAVAAGESVGVVGESGSGKTQAFLAIMGLLARNGRATGSVTFRGRELLGLPRRELNRLRGGDLAMIFQDPMTSLNPYLKVSRQLTEVLEVHRRLPRVAARRRAIEMLELVGIPDAGRRIDLYPHEFSGGMRQRVMIAMALLGEPVLLIADEPTTALDVTIQAQILELLKRLRTELGMAIVLITHDLGVVASLCERLLVMYAGRIVEGGPAELLFHHPQHPYTRGLLSSTPRLDDPLDVPLAPIEGQPPDLQRLADGCPFVARCPFAFARCHDEPPPLRPIGAGRLKACHLEELG
jgi:oligopeptide transport system ATP-binding protein